MTSTADDAMERGEAGSAARSDEQQDQALPSPTSTTLSKESMRNLARESLSNNRRSPDDSDHHSYKQDTAGPIFFRKWISKLSHIFNGRKSMPSSDHEDSEQQLIVRKFSDCPRGYPNLAVFIDSDEAFMLYRRFGFLQARILLNKQDQLRELEERLDQYDKADARVNFKLLMNRSRNEAENAPKTQLLQDIEKCFKEYAELLAAAHTLAGFGKPAKRDYTSVRNYFDGESPLTGQDWEYIYRKEDLITIKPGRENAWLDAFVEKMLQKIGCPPVRYIFCSAETREKADAETVLYDKDRINVLVTLIITMMIIAMLIIPIYLLWHLSKSESRKSTAITIGVLLIFTLIFSTELSFFTKARRHEILGAAAAYCAVLVVFMANTQQNSHSGNSF